MICPYADSRSMSTECAKTPVESLLGHAATKLVGSVTSINAGTGLSGGTITSSGTLSLANTTVNPGSYTRANLTVDAQGRLTAAANSGNVSLTSEVSGTLPVTNRGTGATTATIAYC